jgi:spore germination protein YaaH
LLPLLFVVLAVGLLLALGSFWYAGKWPSNERVAPFDGQKNVIVFQGDVYKKPFAVVSEQILLPFDFIKERIDPNIFWDEASQSVIVTTKNKVMRMESEKLVAYLNRTPVDLQVPVQEIEGVRYVPASPLQKLYPVQFRHVTKNGVLVVEQSGYTVQQGKVLAADEDRTEPQHLRTGASVKEPIVADVAADTEVDILQEEAGWYRVQTGEGIVGFLPKEAVSLTKIRQTQLPESSEKSQPTAWKPLGGKIVLAWEHVVNRNPDISRIPDMPGLNVISPTWFELKDDKGTIGNKADPAYVKWAHGRGYQVWGLVTNGFNPDWTQAVLKDFHLREKMIVQILQYAHLYDLDGINLDFENVYLEDKQRLVQFVRELTPYLHEQGVTVSMDVTIKSSSDQWSRFYDRAALAEVVDYIAVMTYDEHWATSPVAGSVASLPWTEEGLKGVLEEVPHEKLLLGVPFYTRLWQEAKQPDGSVKVTSKALSMMKAEEWINQRKLKPQRDEKSGQLYVSYVDPSDGNTYKMWLEDPESMRKRIALVKKYDLAGVAAWRRGFEKTEIWRSIQQELTKR